MDWVQVLTIIAANIGMFWWLRSETNNDRRELHQMWREMKNETKDFHGRLLLIEEKNRGKKS